MQLFELSSNRYSAAAELLEKGLRVFRDSLGEEHEHTAMGLSNFGKLHLEQGNLDLADSYLTQSMVIHDKCSGGRSLNAVYAPNNLADVRIEQSRFAEAESLLNKAMEVREAKLPAGHAYLANTFHSFGRLREPQENSAGAESFYKRALAIRAAMLPMDHPYRARLLEDYARLLGVIGRAAEASQCAAQEHEARETHAANESVA